MKPIQNQYQDLLEGKMSKHNFLNNVKSTLSQYVSKGNSYEDAISILKSKRILSENISNTAPMGGVTSSKGTAGYIDNTNKKGGDYDPKERAANLAKLKNFGLKKEQEKLPKLKFSDLKSGDILVNKFSGTKYTITNVTDKTADIQQGDDGKEIEIASLNNYELVDTSGFNTDEYSKEISNRYDREQEKHALPGGNMLELKDSFDEVLNRLSEGTSTLNKYINEIDTVNPIEYQNGISFEVDLGGDFSAQGLEKAVKKVLKNLKKDPIYYTNLKSSLGQKANSKKVQSSEYTELKKDNQLDKHNQLKTLIKKEIANTKTTQSKQEKASKAMPKGVKLMKEGQYASKYKIGDSFIVKNLQKDPYPAYSDVKIGDKIKITKVRSNLAGPVYDTNVSEKTGLSEKDISELTSTSIKEIKLEDVKSLLSDETLKNSSVGYGAGDSTGKEVSITYKSYKELPFEDLSKLQDKYQVNKDVLSSEDEPTTVQYFISDKFKSSSPSKPMQSKPTSDTQEDESIFEVDDDKERQKKDFEKFSDKMIGKPSTKQNTIKTKIKEYVIKQLKKEAVKFTIGNEKEYISDTESRGFEDKLRKAGVTKFTKSKI